MAVPEARSQDVDVVNECGVQAMHCLCFKALVSGAIMLIASAPALAAIPNYRNVLAMLRSHTSVPILLPTQLPVAEPIYGGLDQATRRTYIVTLDYTPDCHGAAVCTLGRMSGTLGGGAIPKGKSVQLSGRITGYFIAEDAEENCNTGYCFSRLTWDYRGSRYTLKLKSSDPMDSLKAANSALAWAKRSH
jgi:hypothetical protein